MSYEVINQSINPEDSEPTLTLKPSGGLSGRRCAVPPGVFEWIRSRWGLCIEILREGLEMNGYDD